MARSGICIDCRTTFLHEPPQGCVPKRCAECRRVIARAANRRWYRENSDHARAYAAQRWAALPKLVRPCRDCGTGIQSGRLCAPCRDAARKQSVQSYKDRNRDRLRVEAREYAAKKRSDPAYLEWLRQYHSARRKADPDAARVIRQRSYRKHAEDRRQASRERRRIRRLALYERDGGQCYLCGEVVPVHQFEIDHVFPRSKGGPTESQNLRVTHVHCNRRKAARILAVDFG